MHMQNRHRATVALAALLISGSPLAARAQSPAPAPSSDAMSSMADVPCDKAASMMMTSMMPQASMPASGDVDKAYSTMMAAHGKMMLNMAKVEMRCGKEKKVKDNAARVSPDLQKLVDTLTIF